MSRILPLLTLVPTVFTFVVIILINIGGINKLSLPSYQTDNQEHNTQFQLLNWSFTVRDNPSVTIPRYFYALYLHRFCAGTTRGRACRNIRANGGKLYSDSYAPNAFIGQIDPFNFDTVNLNIPFAFYVLTALAAVGLLFLAPAAGVLRKHRMLRMLGVGLAIAGSIAMLIASSTLTAFIIRLRDQVRDDTTRTAAPLSPTGDSRTVTRIGVPRVSIGKTVLGLTWAASALMLIQMGMWIVSLVRCNKHVVTSEKVDKYDRSSV